LAMLWLRRVALRISISRSYSSLSRAMLTVGDGERALDGVARLHTTIVLTQREHRTHKKRLALCYLSTHDNPTKFRLATRACLRLTASRNDRSLAVTAQKMLACSCTCFSSCGSVRFHMQGYASHTRQLSAIILGW
jgi:hypothetical protein